MKVKTIRNNEKSVARYIGRKFKGFVQKVSSQKDDLGETLFYAQLKTIFGDKKIVVLYTKVEGNKVEVWDSDEYIVKPEDKGVYAQ